MAAAAPLVFSMPAQVRSTRCLRTFVCLSLTDFYSTHQIPFSVTYDDGRGHLFRSFCFIDYTPGHETAVARFADRELIAAEPV